MIDIRPLIRSLWPMPLVGPNLRDPPLLAVNDVRGLVGTQSKMRTLYLKQSTYFAKIMEK